MDNRARRLAAVRRLIERQDSAAEIGRQIAKRFGVDVRTVQRDIKACYEQWGAEEIEDRPRRRARLRQSLTMVYRHAFNAADYKAALAALDRLAKLDGLWERPVQAQVRSAPSLTELVSAMHAQQTGPN